jgi:hypothetical protein
MLRNPLHCDISHFAFGFECHRFVCFDVILFVFCRFGSDRLRLCSSELQGIVNELVLRCKGEEEEIESLCFNLLK